MNYRIKNIFVVFSLVGCSINSFSESNSFYDNDFQEKQTIEESSMLIQSSRTDDFSSCSDDFNSSFEYSSSMSDSSFSEELKPNIYDTIDKAILCSQEYELYCYYTDPHFFSPIEYFDYEEENMINSLAYIQNIYSLSSSQFIVCGGDVISRGDSQSQACKKLSSYINLTKQYFDKHYFIVGNHDTNYQGNWYSGLDYHDCMLPQETLNNILYNGSNSYYYFDSSTTRHYCFDSGIDWVADTLTEYQEKQINWFANSLLSNKKVHNTVFIHMTSAYSDGVLTKMMQDIGPIIEAYNSKKTITIQNTVFDYSLAAGKVDYIQSGHSHKDAIFYAFGIPVLLTRNLCDLDSAFQPSFDIVLVDYTNSKLLLYRVGNGEDRAVVLNVL